MTSMEKMAGDDNEEKPRIETIDLEVVEATDIHDDHPNETELNLTWDDDEEEQMRGINYKKEAVEHSAPAIDPLANGRAGKMEMDDANGNYDSNKNYSDFARHQSCEWKKKSRSVKDFNGVNVNVKGEIKVEQENYVASERPMKRERSEEGNYSPLAQTVKRIRIAKPSIVAVASTNCGERIGVVKPSVVRRNRRVLNVKVTRSDEKAVHRLLEAQAGKLKVKLTRREVEAHFKALEEKCLKQTVPTEETVVVTDPFPHIGDFDDKEFDNFDPGLYDDSGDDSDFELSKEESEMLKKSGSTRKNKSSMRRNEFYICSICQWGTEKEKEIETFDCSDSVKRHLLTEHIYIVARSRVFQHLAKEKGKVTPAENEQFRSNGETPEAAVTKLPFSNGGCGSITGTEEEYVVQTALSNINILDTLLNDLGLLDTIKPTKRDSEGYGRGGASTHSNLVRPSHLKAPKENLEQETKEETQQEEKVYATGKSGTEAPGDKSRAKLRYYNRLRTQFSSKPFCVLCPSKSFQSNDIAMMHLYLSHYKTDMESSVRSQLKNKQELKCPLCPRKDFKGWEGVVSHYSIHHRKVLPHYLHQIVNYQVHIDDDDENDKKFNRSQLAEELRVFAMGKRKGESFVQKHPCFQFKQLEACRECLKVMQRRLDKDEVVCQFEGFRKLRFRNGYFRQTGFLDTDADAKEEDKHFWSLRGTPLHPDLDESTAKFVLTHVGREFINLANREAEAIKLYRERWPERKVGLKRVHPESREMCDVCSTTLFNVHYVCSSCSILICIDCFAVKSDCQNDGGGKKKVVKRRKGKRRLLFQGRDEWLWPYCHNRKHHVPVDLFLTVIICGNLLFDLKDRVEEFLSANQQGARNDVKQELMNDSQTESNSAQGLSVLKQPKIQLTSLVNQAYPQSNKDKSPYETVFSFTDEIHKNEDSDKTTRFQLSVVSRELNPEVSHQWLCDGRLLLLEEPWRPDSNLSLFQNQWLRGQPVMISNCTRNLSMEQLWSPQAFLRDFGHLRHTLINCLTNRTVPNAPLSKFWRGFTSLKNRLLDHEGKEMLLKLKDWPPSDDIKDILPTRFDELMASFSMTEYTGRESRLNLAAYLPDACLKPELGPKMYIAYGSARHSDKGSTNLHIDMSDAVNCLVYASAPDDCNEEQNFRDIYAEVDKAGCDVKTKARVRECVPGALWHIYHPSDTPKIRDLLKRVALEKGGKLDPHDDPIHDQSTYLDEKLRWRLYNEYKVQGYPIVQCMGDTVFIPAGAPHQVRNLNNCIKVAEDFVSPENISHCLHLTNEFRHLTDWHTNHEDKLQIKNIIYHSIKQAIGFFTEPEPEPRNEEECIKSEDQEEQSKEILDPINNGDPGMGVSSKERKSSPTDLNEGIHGLNVPEISMEIKQEGVESLEENKEEEAMDTSSNRGESSVTERNKDSEMLNVELITIEKKEDSSEGGAVDLKNQGYE